MICITNVQGHDADAESVDDLETALKISVNKAVSYLWNFQAWSFRIAETTIKTKANKAYYSMPNGNIQAMRGKKFFHDSEITSREYMRHTPYGGEEGYSFL